MKNNIPYYQHFTNSDQHPKFKMLRVKYGWEGEGKFWALNNRIGLSENCMLNLNLKYNESSIASDLDFSIEKFREFIDYLTTDCELILREDGYITTKTITENLEKVMKKRRINKTGYEKHVSDTFRHIQLSENAIQLSENIQSKVNKSKVNKSKVNKDSGKSSTPLPEIKTFSDTAKRVVKYFLSFLTDIQKKNYNLNLSYATAKKLLALDKYTEDEIRTAIRKAKNHTGFNGFSWSNQFLSFNKLRKKNKDGVAYIVVFSGIEEAKGGVNDVNSPGYVSGDINAEPEDEQYYRDLRAKLKAKEVKQYEIKEGGNGSVSVT